LRPSPPKESYGPHAGRDASAGPAEAGARRQRCGNRSDML